MKINKKQKIKNLHMILNDVLSDISNGIEDLSLAEEFSLDKIYEGKSYDTVLEDEDAFIVHCMNVKHILITIMYSINHPRLLESIKEFSTIEAMQHEIKKGDMPDEVVDTFLDYMNFTKTKKVINNSK